MTFSQEIEKIDTVRAYHVCHPRVLPQRRLIEPSRL